MSDTDVNSWDNSQMLMPLWLQPAASDGPGTAHHDEVQALLTYSAKAFRRVIGAVYKKQGVIDDGDDTHPGDFTVTQGTTSGQINISHGAAVIQNPTSDEGLYIVQSDSVEGITVPASIGSGVNVHRVVAMVVDKADAPDSTDPDKYGWRFRVIQATPSLPAEPPRSITLATISRTGTGPLTIDQSMKLTAAAGGGTAWRSFSPLYLSWTNWSGYAPARYRRTNDGVVMLEGLLKVGTSGTIANDNYFGILPVGFRPPYPVKFPVMGTYHGLFHLMQAHVKTDGHVQILLEDGTFSGTFNANDYVSLNGISFYATSY